MNLITCLNAGWYILKDIFLLEENLLVKIAIITLNVLHVQSNVAIDDIYIYN